MNTYNVDKNIINSETASTTTPELNAFIPLKGPTTKSNTEEVRSSYIVGHLSNKDSNFNMGETALMDSSITQPPPSSPLITSIVHTITISFNPPVFAGILQ